MNHYFHVICIKIYFCIRSKLKSGNLPVTVEYHRIWGVFDSENSYLIERIIRMELIVEDRTRANIYFMRSSILNNNITYKYIKIKRNNKYLKHLRKYS